MFVYQLVGVRMIGNSYLNGTNWCILLIILHERFILLPPNFLENQNLVKGCTPPPPGSDSSYLRVHAKVDDGIQENVGLRNHCGDRHRVVREARVWSKSCKSLFPNYRINQNKKEWHKHEYNLQRIYQLSPEVTHKHREAKSIGSQSPLLPPEFRIQKNIWNIWNIRNIEKYTEYT